MGGCHYVHNHHLYAEIICKYKQNQVVHHEIIVYLVYISSNHVRKNITIVSKTCKYVFVEQLRHL